MILYPRLVLEFLNDKGVYEDKIEEEVKQLPATLSKLYASFMEKIDAHEVAAWIFKWLVTCKRPPTIDELRAVHAIHKASKESKRLELSQANFPRVLDKTAFVYQLRKNCMPLVEIVNHNIIRLVHTTVAQFIRGETIEESAKDRRKPFTTRLIDSHAFIATTCVTLLRWNCALDNIRGSNHKGFMILENKSLEEYAILKWPDHSAKSEGLLMKRKPEKDHLLAFFRDATSFRLWLKEKARLDKSFELRFGFQKSPFVHPDPLHVALSYKMWRVSGKILRETSVDVNACDATGSTPLHIAAAQGSSKMIRKLLKFGAQMDIPDKTGALPLHRAARRGNHAALNALLTSDKVDINAQDNSNLAPLHVACQHGWRECVEILLARKADVLCEGWRKNPVSLAIENGHFEVAQSLLTYDHTLVKHCGQPLINAARRGWSEMVKAFCKAGADIHCKDIHGQTVLHKACIANCKDLVEYLFDVMKVPPDPVDDSVRTPLYFAAERGFSDIVKYLIEHGANVNSLDRRNQTVLFKAAGNGHVAVVDILLKAGADATILDSRQSTPLRFAAMYGRADVVRMLLDRTDIDPDIPDWSGRTVLHVAAAWLRCGQEEIIDILVDHKAHKSCPDKIELKGKGNALHAAIFRAADQPPPTKELLERLIQKGVPLNIRDHYGRTALFRATETQNVEAVKLLLASGAIPEDNSFHVAVRSGEINLVRPFLDLDSTLELHEKDDNGKTALHIAAEHGYDKIIIKLLDANAPTQSLDRERRTPLMCAEEKKHSGAVQLLQPTSSISVETYKARVKRRLWGRNILHWMAESGDHVEQHILATSNVNLQDHTQRTPLHLAVLSGNLDIVQQLLSVQANTELSDENSQTPLHYAAHRSDPAILEAILKAGANVDAVDKWYRTPLHLATLQDNSAVAQILLEHGAEILTDHEYESALHVAIVKGHVEILRSLLKVERAQQAIRYLSKDTKSVFHLASVHGRSCMVTELLQYDDAIAIVDEQDASGRTALHLAAERGHLDIVRQLLDAGAVAFSVDYARYMPAHLAAEAGHEAIVELLLDAVPNNVARAFSECGQQDRLDLSSSGANTAFHETMRLLLQDQPEKGDYDKPHSWVSNTSLREEVTNRLKIWDKEWHSIPSTILMRAVVGNRTEIVKLLLQKVPEMLLQAESHHDGHLLFAAAIRGHVAITELLIEANCNVNVVSDAQMTCLHGAAENGHEEVVRLLLTAGANPDAARLRDSSTPLHLAAMKGHEVIVAILVDTAFINATDDIGRTPLHLACSAAHLTVIDMLLDAGADVSAKDVEGKTPKDRAAALPEEFRLRIEELAEQ
jgi:ankyrin repeat protein